MHGSKNGMQRCLAERRALTENNMAAAKKPHVTLTYLDFESLIGKSPQEVYRQFVITCRLSRKRIFAASVKWNGYRVTETDNRITIHLAQDQREVAYFS